MKRPGASGFSVKLGMGGRPSFHRETPEGSGFTVKLGEGGGLRFTVKRSGVSGFTVKLGLGGRPSFHRETAEGSGFTVKLTWSEMGACAPVFLKQIGSMVVTQLHGQHSEVVKDSDEPMMLVIDLEATCCDQGTIPSEQMEVIEVGAVWATFAGAVVETLQRFVRPMERQILTPFCRSLTHIEQEWVDAAPTWPTVAAELAEFANLHPGADWGSWGNYDANQIERDSARHGIANPLAGMKHQNLKAIFAKGRGIKRVGMAGALKIVGLPLEGEHHRALSDARNTARLLPFLESQ